MYLPAGQAKLAVVPAAYTGWGPTRARVYELATAGDSAAGIALLLSDQNQQAVSALNAGIDELVALKTARQAEVVREERSSVATAQRTVAVAMVFASAACLALALAISRAITRAVQEVQRVLTSLAEHCTAGMERALDAMAHHDLGVEVIPVT